MKIRIITASAGTGKTTRLAEILDEAVGNETARPEAILAATFTKQAAAEILNRARTRLLQSGQGKAARELLNARIGTVNAVCGSLVTDFAFDLGLSPELRILDEVGAALALKRALASVVTDDISNQLQSFRSKFDASFDWHYELRRLIEGVRANGIDADGLAASADRSITSLDACLGPVAGEAEALDAELRATIDVALAAIGGGADTTTGTEKYCAFLVESRRNLDRGRLRWGDWAKLCNEEPTKKSIVHAAPVRAAAARHLGHPRLRADLHELIRLMFDVAGRGIREYQQFKQEQGLLDFVDQEVWALKLLAIPSIQEILKDQLDLVLVDEFQDTSPLQLAIFLKLAELARESVWVGDPKQAIYGFRGTDPALMDAAIESLSSPSRDPALVAAALEVVTTQSSVVETLSRSYRSRHALVELTNAIFVRAFKGQQNMPAERVATEAERPESPELGPAISHWPLSGAQKMTRETLAQCVASGVRSRLAPPPTIWDRHTRSFRPAKPSDVAILCRTNDQCRNVSEALGQLGIVTVVARVGLLDSAEGQVLVAGLRLWVDPRDLLAAATLVRILEHPDDVTSFAAKILAPDGREFLASRPAVAAVLAARKRAEDLDVVAVTQAVVDALDMRRLCAGWGDSIQRVANLDALAAHAMRYCEQRRSSGNAPSVVGFLAHFGELAEGGGWGESRTDTTARVGSDDAVTVSTWHAAKGLEWPIVVLFGLESIREPVAYGVHVLSDRTTFDVGDPLGGRWIHFWPNPYTTANQKGPVKTAYSQSAAHQYVSRQTEHEALRVLYVGWTRARDQLVLAAQQGKLLNGLLGKLGSIEPGLINDPAIASESLSPTTWATHEFMLHVSPSQPAPPVSAPLRPGTIRTGGPALERAVASLAPSSGLPRPARLGEAVRLGAQVLIRKSVDMAVLGTAVHAFLAADDPLRSTTERLEIAVGLFDRHRIAGAIEPSDLVQIGDRLWRWVRERLGQGSRVLTEWPLGVKLDTGTLVLGTSDLVVESDEAVAIIDHKSFGLTTAGLKAEMLSGQLGCYADAVARARPAKPVSTWVHLPFEGVVVEVQRLSALNDHPAAN